MLDFPMASVNLSEKCEEGRKYSLYLAEDESQNKYIVKQYDTSKDLAAFKHESESLSILTPHLHIIGYFGNIRVEEEGLLLLEHCEGGSFRDLIAQEHLDESRISLLFQEVVEAVLHVHSKHILHRNIRPESISLTQLGIVKLTDFSSSITQNELSGLYGIDLSEDIEENSVLEYRAPELLDLTPGFPINTQSDMWALGCLLYEMLCKQKPFANSDIGDQLAGRISLPQSVSAKWKGILDRLFAPDPKDRPTAQELLYMIREDTIPKIEEKSSGFFHKSTNRSVKSITGDNENLVDISTINKLVKKSIEKPFKIPKFFKAVSSRPFSKVIVAVKCLLVFHKYMMGASKVSFSKEASAVVVKIVESPRKGKLMTDQFVGLIGIYGELLIDKLELHRSTNSQGNWTGIEVQSIEMLRKLLKYWTDILYLSNFTLDVHEDAQEILSQMISVLIEEQQRLSVAISEIFLTMPPKDQVIEISQAFQERSLSLEDLIKRFRSKYPLAYLPILGSSEHSETVHNILKKRRATMPIYFENKTNMPKPESKAVEQKTETRLEETVKEERKEEERKSEEKQPKEKQTDEIMLNRLTDQYQGQSWVLSSSDIQRNEVLGVGASSTVYKSLYKFTPVAVKVLRNSKALLSDFEREIKVLVNLRHPNLILFLGACLEPELCIVTELCLGDTLFTLLHEEIHKRLSWRQRIKMAKDIAQGMAYLHTFSPPIIHRDLKSLNLLLTDPVYTQNDNLTVKISDFGVARTLSNGAAMTGQLGTCNWMAPEILQNSSYSLAADVYSYGIVLWEITSREIPYKGLNPANIPSHVIQGGRPDMNAIPQACPSVIKELIVRSLDEDPTLRPTFLEIIESLSSL